MTETFGAFLGKALARKKQSLHAYAIAIGYAKSHSFVYRVSKGLVAPPLKDLERWAEPLGLNEQERKRFELLAGVANSPKVVQSWFAIHDLE